MGARSVSPANIIKNEEKFGFKYGICLFLKGSFTPTGMWYAMHCVGAMRCTVTMHCAVTSFNSMHRSALIYIALH